MNDSQQIIYREWLAYVQRRAAACCRRWDIADRQVVEADFLDGLRRAILSWRGAGPFEGYLNATLRNVRCRYYRQNRKYRHVDYAALEQGTEDAISSEDARKYGYRAVPTAKHPEIYVPNACGKGHRAKPRKRYYGGESSVVREVIRRQDTLSLKKIGKYEAMHVLGYQPEEIAAERKRDRNRRNQQAHRDRKQRKEVDHLLV